MLVRRDDSVPLEEIVALDNRLEQQLREEVRIDDSKCDGIFDVLQEENMRLDRAGRLGAEQIQRAKPVKDRHVGPLEAFEVLVG